MLAGMELRQLRYFVTVAEEGNISRAAQKVFLTQPALSRQIKALEESIGQLLLDRQAHSIRLTPAGQTLLQEARELLRHADLRTHAKINSDLSWEGECNSTEAKWGVSGGRAQPFDHRRPSSW